MGKKLLITGFDPFGGETVNPAWEAVKKLPDRITDYKLYKLEIPTVLVSQPKPCWQKPHKPSRI